MTLTCCHAVLSVLRTTSVEVGVVVMNNLGVGQRSNILGPCHSYLVSFHKRLIRSVNGQILICSPATLLSILNKLVNLPTLKLGNDKVFKVISFIGGFSYTLSLRRRDGFKWKEEMR